MSIIMRMQGLDVKAGAEDIREFFKDLYIPNGGVYILGGQLKEAFIAFGTERHAQLAMRRSGQPLKRSTVNLYISSMEELEHRLKLLLKEKTKPLTIKGSQKDVFSVVRRKPDTSSKPGYVRLFGLPASTTKEEICIFFKGLTVEEVITNVKLGCKVGCLVKFAQKQDASDALCFNQRPLGSHCVEVRAADEKLWAETTDLCSFEKPRSNSGSENVLSLPKEHIVMVSNLPKTITKTELKNFFSCPNLPHKNVLHLLDRSRNITDTAFFIFDSFKDFEYAINLSGCHFGSRTIKVSTITRKMMTEMMFWPDEGEVSKVHQSQAARLCLFVRNMPAGVQKSQIKAFFSKHNFEVKDIRLVCGEDGKSIGEAVLKLESEKIAMLAQQLNGEDFLGEKLLLTCISVKQMEDIGLRLPPTVQKHASYVYW
uniref:RNA binding motif protein 12Ba n=1 Tax=Oryzias melastigma TaxID=30732 RepID=A0A3B3BCU1_ORYME